MSVELGFTPDFAWLESHRATDFSKVSSVDLTRDVLPGDLIFKVSATDFSIIGEKVQLLEFGRALYLAARRVMSSRAFDEIYPLDLDVAFRFAREGNSVVLYRDVPETTAVCTIDELMSATRDFCITLLRFFLGHHPEAARSKVLFKWFSDDDLSVRDLFDPRAVDDSNDA
jgi:hypothetical protein